MHTKITLVGGPTALIDIAGLRIVTDPTFDPPREYPHPLVTTLTKTRGPAFTPEQIGVVDVVLASHEHEDNLDYSGREYLKRVPLVYTTHEVAAKFGQNVVGMGEYETKKVRLPSGDELTITAVPAQHGPEGVWQLIGPVLGFVLSGEGLPTIYISGDNSSLDVIKDVKTRFGTIDIAVLFVGGPSFEVLADGAFITLSNELALEAAESILTESTIVPVHEDSWGHLTQDAAGIRKVFEEAGLSSRIVILEPGQSADIPIQ